MANLIEFWTRFVTRTSKMTKRQKNKNDETGIKLETLNIDDEDKKGNLWPKKYKLKTKYSKALKQC